MSIKRVDFEYALSKAISGAIIEFCNKKKCDQPAIDALVDEAWQCLNGKSPHALQRKRRAIIECGQSVHPAIAVVKDYLPSNYTAKKRIAGWTLNGYAGACIEIEGYDIAGWTLDDYVIPRLASGLIVATEVFEAKEFDHDED